MKAQIKPVTLMSIVVHERKPLTLQCALVEQE